MMRFVIVRKFPFTRVERPRIYTKREDARKEKSRDGRKKVRKKSRRYRHQKDGVMVQASSFLSMSLTGRLCIMLHDLADMTLGNVTYSSSRESHASALGK
jgi:hypothetical protein